MITYLKRLPDPAPKFEVGCSVEITDNSGLLKVLKSGVMETAVIAACNANRHARTPMVLVATGCKLPRSTYAGLDEPNQYIVVDSEGVLYFTNHIKLWRA